ncbi:hypothetical protein HK405_012472, partial [Cladochytrium tenue]
TSYLILFAHLRPVLARSDIRLIFVTCHESLDEVTVFLQSFAFWLRSLKSGVGDASHVASVTSASQSSLSAVLPGEIYVDTARRSYAFFGLRNNMPKIPIARSFIKNNVWKATGRSHIGKRPMISHKLQMHNRVISEIRFFRNVEMEALLSLHPSKSKGKFQRPVIVVVENEKVIYRVRLKFGIVTGFKLTLGAPLHQQHIVTDHEHVIPDVFAFGVIMWEVATRSRPWLGVPLRDVRDAVVTGHRPPMPSTSVADNEAKWPPHLVALMHDCWAQSPSERPEFRAVVRRLAAVAVPPE